MKQEMHVVLGGAGAMGQAVIAALLAQGKTVKAVERSKVAKGVDTTHADLMHPEQVQMVVKGANYVYVCIGLPYRNDVWKRDWPRIIRHVIDACEKYQAKLIFLDNAYMYGPSPLKVPFNEHHLQFPTTIKGQARKEVADLILKAHREKRIQAVIGRSADFYGPFATNSPFYIQFIENIIVGKNPGFMGKKGVPHTYAFTLDNGKALVELALDESCYGEVWHLPVNLPITADEAMIMINRILNSNHKVAYLPQPLLGIVSLFVPPVKEARPMLYQFNEPYHMDDSKFRKKFPTFVTTSYEDGFRVMLNSFKD